MDQPVRPLALRKVQRAGHGIDGLNEDEKRCDAGPGGSMKSLAHTLARFARLAITITLFLIFADVEFAAHAAEGSEAAATTPAAAVKNNADKVCQAFGPDYIAVGNTGLCTKFGAGILVSVSQEFTDRDIVMVGQRIPTLFNNGAGAPIVFYHEGDVSKQTKNPSGGVYSWAQMMVQTKSDWGVLRGFVRVAADARTRYDHDGDAVVDLRKIEDSYYYGALDEAWVQWNGLKVGIQPSMFGFNRLPTVVTPGYSSIVNTLGASYTLGISRNASLSLAFEDPERRIMADGILARPARSNMPDIVAMARIATPSTLYHFSGALHHVEDHVLSDFVGGRETSVWGWALSAGLQSRVAWQDIVGPAGEGTFGRFSFTAAYSSGAPAYLGIPFFAPDYIAAGDGARYNSKGWSAVTSYEHMLTPRVKLSLSASYFNVWMHSDGEPVVPEDGPDPLVPDLNFEVDVHGTVLQAGLEFMPRAGMVIGVEAGHTTTSAKGRYVDFPGERATVGFPHIGAYLRQTF